MNFCQDHWDRLRAKIDDRGLMHLVAPDGQTAAAQLADQLSRGGLDADVSPGEAGDTIVSTSIDEIAAAGEAETVTPVNFDPLQMAFFAVGSNAMETIQGAGMNPFYLLASPDTPEDPIEFGHFRPGLAAATAWRLGNEQKPLTWPRCGLCYLGLAHELTCTERRCSLPRVDAYAWMLDRAADDALTKARELGLVKSEAA